MIQFNGQHGPVFLSASSILAVEQAKVPHEPETFQRLHLSGSSVLVRETNGDVLMLMRMDRDPSRTPEVITVQDLRSTYARSEEGRWLLVGRPVARHRSR